MNTADKVQAINEHLENQCYHDDKIYTFDDHTINELFSTPWEALRACHFGETDFTHDYFRFNGHGNIETLAVWQINEEFEELETDEEE